MGKASWWRKSFFILLSGGLASISACGDFLGLNEDDEAPGPTPPTTADGSVADGLTGPPTDDKDAGDNNDAADAAPAVQSEIITWQFDSPGEDQLPTSFSAVKGWSIIAVGGGAVITADAGSAPPGALSAPNFLEVTRPGGSLAFTRTIPNPKSVSLKMSVHVVAPPGSPQAIIAFYCTPETPIVALVLHPNGALGLSTDLQDAGSPLMGPPTLGSGWNEVSLAASFNGVQFHADHAVNNVTRASLDGARLFTCPLVIRFGEIVYPPNTPTPAAMRIDDVTLAIGR